MPQKHSTKTIQLKNQEVSYTLKKSPRARRARLTVYCDGNFVVTMPRRFPLEKVEEFIQEKSDWVLGKLKVFQENPERRISLQSSREEYARLKYKAYGLAKDRLERYNQSYGFKWEKISIRNQKTRWGSCSRDGNLSYNCKIAILPEKYADYIIVHELCHLKEFNHSRCFWKLVEKTIPDCRQIRKELRNL